MFSLSLSLLCVCVRCDETESKIELDEFDDPTKIVRAMGGLYSSVDLRSVGGLFTNKKKKNFGSNFSKDYYLLLRFFLNENSILVTSCDFFTIYFFQYKKFVQSFFMN